MSEIPRIGSVRQGDDLSSELQRLLLESVTDYGIFGFDAAGTILTWNRGAQRLYGYSAHDIIGAAFATLHTPEDATAELPAADMATAAAQGRAELERWRVTRDGERFLARVVLTALRNERDELVGYAEIAQDLGERRNAEMALHQSEQRFRLLVTSVRDYGIFMLDPDGVIVSWNEGAQRIKGYEAHQIIGKHFSIFYPPEDANWKPAYELEVASEVGRFEDEGWRLRRDGSRFWANVVITALRDGTGTLVGFAKVTRDLTERRAAEQRAIEDARRMAEMETANRVKSEFLAAMSHELRTPLNAIGGYTDLILLGIRGPITEGQREDLERIRTSQQHLLGIVNDILNFSRIEAGRITYEIEPVALAGVYGRVRDMIRPQALTAGLQLLWEDAPAGVQVLADRTKLEQILLNLLTNAIKFTPAGGILTVDAEVGGEQVRIDVRDTGIGIPPDQIESIFEPFVQVGRSLSSGVEGAGLGLAISRELARAMDGDLTAASEPGRGSTFSLTVPRAPAAK